jgi:hypothetical protein
MEPQPQTVKQVDTHQSPANGFGMLVLMCLTFAAGWMGGRSVQFNPAGIQTVANVHVKDAFIALVLIVLAFALLGKLATAKKTSR